jgi:3-oxoacyl-[acyl-carrier protein] reductase
MPSVLNAFGPSCLAAKLIPCKLSCGTSRIAPGLSTAPRTQPARIIRVSPWKKQPFKAAQPGEPQSLGELEMSLSQRVAFVTGASQGIGRACALRLAKEGATVAVAARNQDKLNELVSEITSAGAKSAAFVVDVSDEEPVKSSIKAAIAQFGKIDILVNNAGITRDQLVMRMKRADWDAVLQTNLTSAYLCIQNVIPSMLKQRWGRIINITSVFGQMGQAGQANYAASKAGLIGLTMAIAREVGSRNITSNAIAPGFIETAMTSVLSDEFKQNAVKQIPLGRVGTSDDVAAAVAFLASDEASYITGHVLNVNGGMLMG